MSDAPGDNKPKPIFNPDDSDSSAAPLIDFGADTKADANADAAKAEAKADAASAAAKADAAKAEAAKAEAAAKADAKKAEAKADKAAAKADAKVPSGSATGEVAPAATTDSEFAGREVVYVQAPVPPRLKGNRGIGSLLAVLGVAVFAAAFAALGYVLIAAGLAADGATFADFILSPEFLIPIPIFLVAFVLLVLIVNRAGWAAHVFGSLLVGLAVYFGTAGVALVLFTVSGGDAPSYGDLLSQPFIIIAALIAREVSIWIGLAIAARGRRVKVRNHEIVDEWEREHADTRAQYERATTA
jgi:hypothetical protein